MRWGVSVINSRAIASDTLNYLSDSLMRGPGTDGRQICKEVQGEQL